jgi:hypothetical protein
MAYLDSTLSSVKGQSMSGLNRICARFLDLIREFPVVQYLLVVLAIALCVNLGLNPFLSAVLS